jgi:CelD/BcsL family acetyltransferase involved in cellulose biosynthesis
MKVERITEFGRFQDLSNEWNALLSSSDVDCVFLTHEWFSSWWKHLSGKWRLEVLVFKDTKGQIVGIAPLMTDGLNLRFMASYEVTDYCDFLSVRGNMEEFYKSLLSYLRENYPDQTRLEFMNIKASSPSCALIPELGSHHGFSYNLKEAEVAPVLAIPSNYDSYIASLNRKNRHELRRKLRRIEALDGIQTKKITGVQNIGPAIDDFISLHRQSSPEKHTFWKTRGMAEFFRHVVHRFCKKAWVELNFLNSGDSLIAAILNFLYADEVLFYNVAYDPDYASYSPGFYLFHASIVEAISQKKSCVDFLRGREKYKYDFGAKECKIYSLTLITGESIH